MSDTSLFSGRDLHEQREKIQRSFLRANTAIGVVLLAVLGLALAAVVASLRASRNQERAESAEQDAREKLWNSYLVQARAARLSGQRGHRMEALTAVSNAAAFRASTELRNEAIAALMCSDLESDGPMGPVRLPFREAMQFGLGHYVSATFQGSFSLYRMSDHAEVARFGIEGTRLPAGTKVAGVAFSGDARHVFATCHGGSLAAWSVPGGTPVWDRTVTKGRRLVGLTTGFDGRWCVTETTGKDSFIEFVRPGASAPPRTMTVTGAVLVASIRPGTNQLALSYGTEVQFLDYDRGATTESYSYPTPAMQMAWSRDGTQFAVANAEGTIYLRNLVNGVFQSLIGHVESVRTLTFSPDGEQLLSSSWDNTTRLWDTISGRAIITCNGEIGMEFSEDGRRIGYTRPGVGMGIWKFVTSPLLETLQQSQHVRRGLLNFDLSPDGRWLVAVMVDGMFLWDLSRDVTPAFLPLAGLTTATFHPDERQMLLCRSNRIELRTILGREPGEELGLGPSREIPLPPGTRARQATISLDGRSALVELESLRFVVVDVVGERAPVLLQSGQRLRHRAGPATGTGSGRMAISSDGRWVIVGYGLPPPTNRLDLESVSVVWDARSGQPVVPFGERAGSVMFSPDASRLVLRTANGCRLLKTGSWELERSYPLDSLIGQIGAVAVPREGELMAVSSTRQAIELLDSKSGREMARLIMPFAASVYQLRCSLDGSRLIAAAPYGRIHLWDLNALRRSLSGLGLDWGNAAEAGATALNNASRRISRGNPATMIAAGFVGVAIAVFSAFIVLRRHRHLIARFVRTEATVEKRDRQLEVARLELMQAEKMKALGTLAAGIAHDFNNLLSVIRMSNQLIPRSRSPKETAEYVAAVEQAVLQGKTVVGSMLGYSRESPPDDKPTDICTLVEEVALLLSREFLSGVELRLELNRATPQARVNKGKLQQALLNLVVNASEAMKGSGKLTLSVAHLAMLPEFGKGRFAVRPNDATGYVQIAVADTGPGIPTDILDRIFEPFFTTKTAGTRKGTGLGLSLVHTVAGQEGLGLAVQSKPGTGATFYLFIPET